MGNPNKNFEIYILYPKLAIFTIDGIKTGAWPRSKHIHKSSNQNNVNFVTINALHFPFKVDFKKDLLKVNQHTTSATATE